MQRLAHWNGRWVAESSLSLAVEDRGFLLGATVTERLRTFGRRLFRLEEHWTRLCHSLELVGGTQWVDLEELAATAQRLVDHNARGLDADDDQGLVVFLTPGPAGGDPTVCLYSRPLPFAQWASLYRTGQRLVVSSHRQVPSNCWPPSLKCRSRMHYYLADQEASRREPGSRALVLDQRGYVAEATTANVVCYFETEGLVTPRAEFVLPGVSLAVVRELADDLGLPWSERDMTPKECATADEMFLCSTSPCLLPVSALDGRPIGRGHPGPIFETLISAWSRLVGRDIVGQAHRFAERTL